LLEQGYVTLKDPSLQGELPLFLNVDWSKTTAYAVGIQGLYINLKGRESKGIVEPGREYELLLDRLETDLLAIQDERSGLAPIRLVFRPREEWQNIHLEQAPDIVVGYEWGYRSSWDSPLGQFPQGVFVDNNETWSGDHSIDYRLVPGILLSNRQITLDKPALYDLTVAVLDEFGVAPLPQMIGEDTLEN
jgi:predicted AlkP superfamily phosphohydrolase/phosphomutase